MSIFWTEDTKADLRHLWVNLKLPTAEIARRLNTTKNAVVGKAHRMDLDMRPSPILLGTNAAAPISPETEAIVVSMRRFGHNAVYIAARLGVSLVGVRRIVAALPPAMRVAAPLPPAARVVCTAPPKPPEAPKPAPAPRGKSERRCEWLDGDKPYTRCTDAHLPGRPYCDEHCRAAYVHWPTRRTAPAVEAPVLRPTW